MTDDGPLDVGVIGLGAMGGPISTNLVRAGLRVGGFDIDGARREALVSAGGETRRSTEALTADAPILLTSLPSAEALWDVTSAIGRAAGLRPGLVPIVVETSTLSEATKRRSAVHLASVGVTMLDCPLSGTAVQAVGGDLVVYASGDEEALDRCEPVFRAMARSVHRLGPFGAGTRTKLVANLLVAVHIVSAAEAIVLARAAGMDLDRTLAALTDGAGTSRMLEVRGPMMVREDFDSPSMTLRLFGKDESLIREFAASLDVPVPLFEDASRLLRAAADSGHADRDTAAVYASLVEALAEPG